MLLKLELKGEVNEVSKSIFKYGFFLTFTGLFMIYAYRLVRGFSTIEMDDTVVDHILFIPHFFIIIGLIILLISILIGFKNWSKNKANKIS
jgi:anaerobic C4-dicarboxylate transporter